MALWTLPNTFAALSGTQPAGLLDANYSALADYCQYSATTGGTNAITLAVPLPFPAYAYGMRFGFIAAGTNTGAVTLNVNGIGPIAVQYRGVAVARGTIIAGGNYEAFFDGVVFQLLTASPSCLVYAYFSANQNTPPNTYKDIGLLQPFTVVLDRGSNFTGATGSFIAPYAGAYRVDFRASLVNGGASTDLFYCLIANAALAAGGPLGSTVCSTPPLGGFTNVQSCGSSVMLLTNGQQLKLWIYHDSPGTRFIAGGQGFTDISITAL